MTFIAPDGGRTVTNGTVHDKRKVYEIIADAVLDEVKSVYGSGEVERTGRKVGEQRVYHVIAKSEDLARTVYEQDYANAFRAPHTLVSITPLFVIDGEIGSWRY